MEEPGKKGGSKRGGAGRLPHAKRARRPKPKGRAAAARGFPVVGVGAAAGALDALESFFGAVPREPRAAFVLVHHRERGRAQDLVGRLAKCARMPVSPAAHATPLEPDHVYVVPPDAYPRIQGGELFLQEPLIGRGKRMPIDHFFRSLADAGKERAICVLLSGTESDGAMGLRDVKAAGGMTMVQAPETAERDGRRRPALATGLVDFSLPPSEMPDVLMRYASHPYVEGTLPPAVDGGAGEQLLEVLDLVREHCGHDFRCYKEASIARRIQRRMGLRQIEAVADYARVLRDDPREAHGLFRDLLIGVTRFFRDKECWSAMEEIVADIVARRDDTEDPIRVWAPGCATGEELYGLGILFLEQFEKQSKNLTLNLFGTDLDESAIAVARAGSYPENIASDVTRARLSRFFKQVGGEFRVTKRLRDASVFAVQNIVSDPPFSGLDLVSCRNVMIYLQPEVQRQLVASFHFALRPNGVLFVGPSEALGRDHGLFEPQSTTYRIYRKVGRGRGSIPVATARRDGGEERRDEAPGAAADEGPGAAARRALAELYGPASVLIDRRGEVLYLHGKLRAYLDFPTGEASHELAALALPALRSDLRTAIRRAMRREEPVTRTVSGVERETGRATVRLSVTPLAGDCFLVVFEDLVEEREAKKKPRSRKKDKDEVLRDGARVEALERELQGVRDDLQSTIEDLETSNEELQASNEEVMSTNEELQSVNEELETSKEELQSLNEELRTVNSQLAEKVRQVEGANSDLANLLTSTEIATVFLDQDLRIRRFTPAMSGLLNVIESDVGRPISDLSPRVDDPDLLADAELVLDRLDPIQREVSNGGGRSFLRRILPYRRSDGRTEGVVVTYTDVTDLRRALRRVEVRERQQKLVAELGRAAVATDSLQELFDDAVRKVSLGLGTPLAKILELLPGGDELVVRAGVGWRDGLVGKTRIDTGIGSQSGFTLQSRRPIVVEDLTEERRFSGAAVLTEHGVRSGISVVIGSADAPWGVLGAYGREPRSFTMDDVHFLEAVAYVLADAVRRTGAEDLLRRRAREMSLLFQATTSVATSLEEALQSCVDAVCEVAGFPIGHAYVVAPNGRELVSSGVWHVEDEAVANHLLVRSDRTRYRRGEGFPGAVWQRRDRVCVGDVGEEQAFDHPRFRTDPRVRGAFAFPIVVDDDVAAVLEFFSHEELDAAAPPLDLVRTLGEQVGRVYERNRAAEQLRRGTERLSLALQAAGLGAWEWDVETGELAWTDAHYRMLGYEPGEVRPTYELWRDHVHPDDRVRVEETLRSAEGDGRAFDSEYRIVRRNGEARWVEVRGQCSTAGGGRRMHGVQLDVTERREMEARLREADRRKDTFLSTLGHELRNPLGAVAHGVQLLQAQHPDEGELRAVCNMVERQVRLMTNLLNDLLDVGRIARGNIGLDRKALRLAEHVARAIETERGELQAKRHDVTVDIDPPDLSIAADPVRLEQILVNLLSNAARYTGEGGSIRVDARRADGATRVTVSDTGAGLSGSEPEDVFEPFFQVRKGSGGLGIGLSLVRNLVELHGGTATARSDGAGKGSAFTVTFPDGDVEVGGDVLAPEPAGTGLEDLRVLAVDDHEESLEPLGRLLASHCRVATATTGEAAIEEARRFRPHVLLLDLALPDMSGFEVAAVLAEEPGTRDAVRIAMTGFGDIATEAEIADAGFDEHLLKPIEFKSLLAILHRAGRSLRA